MLHKYMYLNVYIKLYIMLQYIQYKTIKFLVD